MDDKSIMSHEERVAQIDLWLKNHRATSAGDPVYDKMGMITLIDYGTFDYEIQIRPVSSTHNLGRGYGNIIILHF